MRKILVFLVSAVVCAWSALASESAVPMRIGPVSVYGALGTNGSKIVSQSTGEQVILRGMSLNWSDAFGIPYYTPIAITWAVDNLGIDVIRYAMAVQQYKADESEPVDKSFAYISSPTSAEDRIDKVVKTAIENDIYVIIDWHSHRALSERGYAGAFFKKMAERYKNVPNIIWEVFNEPVNDGQGSISSYANEVIAGIRQYSSNLALVGTEFFSQLRGGCTGVTATNSAYVFHFYAHEHPLKDFQGRINDCLNGGNAVFISEWGTTAADGKTNVNATNTNQWTSYMDQKMISSCNWSYRHIGSGDNASESSMFKGTTQLVSLEDFDNAQFSTSGALVKNYLTSNRRNWDEIYTSGARSGSCAFAHTAISIGDGDKSGVASASCTYQSSNPNVAVIENGTIKVKSAGVAIMTGNDNTKTVVRITPLPDQSLTVNEITCYLNKECAGGSYANLSNTGSSSEKVISLAKTIQGSSVTISSDNPDVISVKKATCSNSARCYGSNYNAEVWLAEIKSLGTVNLHITAPAVKGYAALDMTVQAQYLKNVVPFKGRVPSFNDQTIEYNSEIELQMVSYDGVTPVTYTLSNTLATLDGSILRAGDQPGSVWLIADIPETDRYQAYKDSVRIVIDHDPYEGIKAQTVASSSINAQLYGNRLLVNTEKRGMARVRVFDMLGRHMLTKVENLTNATEFDLSSLGNGNYIIKIEMGSEQKLLKWNKK